MATEVQIQELSFDGIPFGNLPLGGIHSGLVDGPFRVTAMQRVAVAGTVGTDSAAISLATRYVRVFADSACKLKFGTWDGDGAAVAPASIDGNSAGIYMQANTARIFQMPIPPKRTFGLTAGDSGFQADAAAGIAINVRDLS